MSNKKKGLKLKLFFFRFYNCSALLVHQQLPVLSSYVPIYRALNMVKHVLNTRLPSSHDCEIEQISFFKVFKYAPIFKKQLEEPR